MVIECPQCDGLGKTENVPQCTLCNGLGDVSQCHTCKKIIPEGKPRYRLLADRDFCTQCWERDTEAALLAADGKQRCHAFDLDCKAIIPLNTQPEVSSLSNYCFHCLVDMGKGE